MSEPFLGELRLFGFNYAPRSWANCDGQLLPISQNSALFSLLGTMYGGDGSSTFALPELRGRTPIHTGQGPGLPNFSQGSKSGSVDNVLSTNNLPPHNHPAQLHASMANANAVSPDNAGLAVAREDTYGAAPLDLDMHSESITTSNIGSGTPVNNMQPYQALRWCIALQGIYPSRS